MMYEIGLCQSSVFDRGCQSNSFKFI